MIARHTVPGNKKPEFCPAGTDYIYSSTSINEPFQGSGSIYYFFPGRRARRMPGCPGLS